MAGVVLSEQAGARPLSAAEVRVTAQKQMQQELDGIGQIRKILGPDGLRAQAGKKPAEVIGAINQKGADWQDNPDTQAFVERAVGLNTQIQRKVGEFLDKAQKAGTPLTPEEAQDMAEKAILTERVHKKRRAAKGAEKAKIPAAGEKEEEKKGDDDEAKVELTVEKNPLTPEEQIEAAQKAEKEAQAKEKAAADKAESERIKGLMDEWVKEGSKPENARMVLEGISAERAVKAAEKVLQDLNAEFTAKSGDAKAAEQLRNQYKRAEKVLQEAEKARTKLQAENEKMRHNASAPTEQRLLAYDIDTHQTNASLSATEQQVYILKAKLEATPEAGKKAVQAELDVEEAKMNTLKKRQETLRLERSQIGSSEQQAIDYVAGQITLLSEGLSRTGESQDIKAESIRKDPLGYMEKLAAEMGIDKILSNSDLSETDQKSLIELANLKKASGEVQKAAVKEKITDTGKQGILVLLLLLYTAYGANKKAKGGQG